MKVEIGKRLRKLRLLKGLTQKELASKIQGGLDYTYIGKIEQGKQLPSLKILVRISEALSAPTCYFFRDEAMPTACEIPASELMLLVKDTRGRELLNTLKSLHEDDIPLVTEIARVLNRHRRAAKRNPSGTGGKETLMAAEGGASYGIE